VEKDYRERRKNSPPGDRRSFGELAKAALNLRVRDARVADARWVVERNMAWVSWKREDSRHAYACIRRRLDFIGAELGASIEPAEMDALPLVTTPAQAPPQGCRIELGSLLHGHAKTWSAGGSEKALIERLDWLAQQLSLRLYAFMAATAPPATEPPAEAPPAE
jgi:hypothetical protein